ncbi:acyltransferase family protein [Glaciecola siphonariae]|uniref:Acyltransferase family protein n=1 Tax=Glaciecola siphonariae TaxID=521012 RepID=A0ABV9M0I2_9ALTE
MQYRPDIDGLRTIAVLSVLLFHFGSTTLSGGFVGVDVFFVISGYLITSILLHDFHNDTFSFVTFYDKRIRRLFPALFAMLGASFFTAYFLFMPDEFKEFAESAAATALYVSNFYFWLKSDYFAGPSELKPLLHTWSLAIEEQFYLIFPVFLLFCFKQIKAFILPILLVVTLVSFIAGMATLENHASSAFFLSPLRFWELLAGAILGYLHFQKYTLPDKYCNIVSLLGLSLIIFAALTFSKASHFPGLLALMPVIGAVCIIAARSSTSLVSKLLSTRLFVFTGKISYSLYLWHWPVVVFYGYWLIRPFELFDQLLMMFVTLGLSLFSYYVFESPFRKLSHKFSFVKSLAVTTVLSACFIALGGFVSLNNGLPERFKPSALVVEQYAAKKDEINPCFLKTNAAFSNWQANKCVFGTATGENTHALWGDSHANHLLPGISARQTELQAGLYAYASAGCPPTLFGTIKSRPRCVENNHAFIAFLEGTSVKHIYLAASWFYAMNDGGMLIEQMQQTVDVLLEKGFTVSIINQLPIYSISSPEYLLSRLENAKALDNAYYLKPARGLETANLIQRKFSSAQVINLHKAFCTDKGECAIYDSQHLMVSDHAHLSEAGSLRAFDYLREHFNRSAK